LTADDSVIVNPPDSIVSGEAVRITAAPPNGPGNDASGNP
jgi:hypothetical protein